MEEDDNNDTNNQDAVENPEDEQIVNLLAETLGGDVGLEILRDFSHSEAFGELLDLVLSNSSISPDHAGGSSRRTSSEEFAAIIDNATSNRRLSTLSNQNVFQSTSSSENAIITPSASIQEDTITADEEPPTLTPEGLLTTAEEEKIQQKSSVTASSSEEKIHQKSTTAEISLKIKIDTTTRTKAEKISKKEKESFGGKEKREKEKKEADMARKKAQDKQKDKKSIDMEGSSSYKKSKDNRRGVKNFKPHIDEEHENFKKKQKLKLCSVILCDLVNMGGSFRVWKGKDPYNSSSYIPKKLVVLSNDKVKETHHVEKLKRLFFVESVNKHLFSIGGDKQQPSTSTSASASHQKESSSSKKSKDKMKDSSSRSQQKESSSSSKSKPKNEVRVGGNKEPENKPIHKFELEMSDLEAKKAKIREEQKRAREERLGSLSTKYQQSKDKDKEEYTASGTRILGFERKRGPDDSRSRKLLDQFESEREKKQGKGQKDKLAQSFRIPKKKTWAEKVTSVTPLATQQVPTENLKFERFRKTKTDRRGDFPSLEPYEAEAHPSTTTREPDSRADFDNNFKLEVKLEDERDGSFEDCPSIDRDRPVSDVGICKFASNVVDLLKSNLKIEVPTVDGDSHKSSEANTIHKIAWWFVTHEKDPPPFEENIVIPELINDIPSPHDDDNDDNESFIGNVSNPGGSVEECQINEISSSDNRAPDYGYNDAEAIEYEHCGHSLLEAKIRIGEGDAFKKLFDTRPGTNYDKKNFQARCNICDSLIVGRQQLSKHIKSVEHKEKLVDTSLRMAKSDGVSSSRDAEKRVKAGDERERNEKESGSERESRRERGKDRKSHNGKNVDKSPTGSRSGMKLTDDIEIGRTSSGLSVKIPASAKEGDKIRRSRRSKSKSPSSSTKNRRRSRSPIRGGRIARSPGRMKVERRSRSRSPRRRARRSRSNSGDRVSNFLARTNKRRSRSRSPHSKRRRTKSRSRTKSPAPSNKSIIRSDNKEFHEKLALTAEGKWTPALETCWIAMENEEKIFKKDFQDQQKLLAEKPERHPKYAAEWKEFWERRYQEVEQSDNDPDTYDYVTEWKDFWLQRLHVLMTFEAEAQLKVIKIKYGVDYDSLHRIRSSPTNPPPPIISPQQPGTPNQTKTAMPILKSAIKSEPVVKAEFPVVESSGGTRTSEDDFTAKSMSISSGGVSDIVQEDDRRKGKENQPTKGKVTVGDIQTTWENLTQPKVIDSSKSEAESSSTASYDFDGFDLVQILRLMCQLEDQLSFLAPKVQDFFRQAEALELQKRHKSYTLLGNEEVVGILFQCRDRFMSMIRAKVLPREVLKSLNLTVYALNSMLDAPQCQKFRPKEPSTLAPETVAPISLAAFTSSLQTNSTLATTNTTAATTPTSSAQLPQVATTAISTALQRIGITMKNVSLAQKVQIANSLAASLSVVGRDYVTESDLIDYVAKMLGPALKGPLPSSSSTSAAASSSISRQPLASQKSRNNDSMSHMRRGTSSSAENSGTDFGYTSSSDGMKHKDEDRHYQGLAIIGTREVGQALPAFGEVSTRAATPPPQPHQMQPTNPFRRGMIPPRGGGGGRRSPFSRRDYSGNPTPESSDQGSEDGSMKMSDSILSPTPPSSLFSSASQYSDPSAKFRKEYHKLSKEIVLGQQLQTPRRKRRKKKRRVSDDFTSPLKSGHWYNKHKGLVDDDSDAENLPSNLPPGIRSMLLSERIRTGHVNTKMPSVERLSSDYGDGKRSSKKKKKKDKKSKKRKRKKNSVPSEDDDDTQKRRRKEFSDTASSCYSGQRQPTVKRKKKAKRIKLSNSSKYIELITIDDEPELTQEKPKKKKSLAQPQVTSISKSFWEDEGRNSPADHNNSEKEFGSKNKQKGRNFRGQQKKKQTEPLDLEPGEIPSSCESVILSAKSDVSRSSCSSVLEDDDDIPKELRKEVKLKMKQIIEDVCKELGEPFNLRRIAVVEDENIVKADIVNSVQELVNDLVGAVVYLVDGPEDYDSMKTMKKLSKHSSPAKSLKSLKNTTRIQDPIESESLSKSKSIETSHKITKVAKKLNIPAPLLHDSLHSDFSDSADDMHQQLSSKTKESCEIESKANELLGEDISEGEITDDDDDVLPPKEPIKKNNETDESKNEKLEQSKTLMCRSSALEDCVSSSSTTSESDDSEITGKTPIQDDVQKDLNLNLDPLSLPKGSSENELPTKVSLYKENVSAVVQPPSITNIDDTVLVSSDEEGEIYNESDIVPTNIINNENIINTQSDKDTLNQSGDTDTLNQSGDTDTLNQSGDTDTLNQSGDTETLNQSGDTDTLNQSELHTKTMKLEM